MLVDFSKAPDDVLGYFVDLRNDLDAFFMYLSSFYGVELHRRDSLIIFDEVQLYPKAREAIKQLVADGRYDYIETGSLVSCLCSMVLRPVERLVFSPKER